MASLATAELDALRAKIAAIEKRPVLAEGAAERAVRPASVPQMPARSEAADILAAPAGVLHEVFADEQRLSGTALGFTLGMARGLIGGERQAILYLQLAAEAQELGLPYSIGLERFGLDPDKLVIGRIESLTELLWAIEEAIACRAIAGVIADLAGYPKALDFTVSRRLSMRAAAAGTSAFIIRYGRQREASAAKLRWRVMASLSAEQRFDAFAPGPPSFVVEVEKRRLGGTSQRAENTRLTLDWTENGFVSVEPRLGPQFSNSTPISRPQPAALGHRLSQAS
jgi:protein ImuA